MASPTGMSRAALAGRTFWATTSTATTAIQVTLMIPSATNMSMSPRLEPTQHSPNCSPERAVSWQRRRKCTLSGVSSYTPAAMVAAPAATYPCGRYRA